MLSAKEAVQLQLASGCYRPLGKDAGDIYRAAGARAMVGWWQQLFRPCAGLHKLHNFAQDPPAESEPSVRQTQMSSSLL